MSIAGIGVDLVEVARIESSITRLGEAFLERVFTADERAYCEKMSAPGPHFAARFAAKEAVSKAFGTGIGAGFGFRDIEVQRRENGAPLILLHAGASELAKRLGIIRIHLSLTHTDHQAVAYVIAEKCDPVPQN